MFSTRQQLALLMFACLLAALLGVSDGRPHIRHHRGGSHCSRCGPGWGVMNRCSKGRDTECGKCSRGTYSPHHSTEPCWICSRCGPGLYEAHPCTGRADTVCDSCHRRSLDNPDFQMKCRGRNFFLAPEDADSTGEQSVLVNETKGRFDTNEMELILSEDVEAALGTGISEEIRQMQRL